MALPAFAAECRAAAPLLLGASRCRPISSVRMALSTRQQTRRGCGRVMGQTNGRTDVRPIVA